MTNSPFFPAQEDLTDKDRQRIASLITELKRRNLAIPAELYAKFDPKHPPNLDENGYHPKMDGKHFNPNEKQLAFLESKARFKGVISGRGGGKALSLDTPILTFNRGWTTMGDIRVGDWVFDEMGYPCRVLFESDVMYGHDCYDVLFSDGSIITADAEHLWCSWDNGRYAPMVITTVALLKIISSDSESFVFYVPDIGSLEFLLGRNLINFRPGIGRFVSEIRPASSVPVKCIQVDSPSHLYLAGKSLIPTHNTTVGSHAANQKILAGESGAVLNPDMENFKISTWPEFREWLPWEMVVVKHQYMRQSSWSPRQPFHISFVNGAKVYCKGLKDPDSARGPNINWLWYDEAGRDETGEAWQIASASVRVGNNPQCWITTTPKGKNHWIYKFFVKQDIPQEAKDMFLESNPGKNIVDVFHMSILDNKANLDPGFVAAMLAAYPSGWLREQEIYGKFVDEGGVLGDRSWFNDRIVDETPFDIHRRIRYWDMAATERKISGKKRNDPDETTGTLLAWDGKKDFAVEHQECGFWEWQAILDHILVTAKNDGAEVPIWVEEEPGSGGKNQVAAVKSYITEKLGAAWKVQGHKPHGDKVMRANIWFGEASQGQFWLIKGKWLEKTLDQISSFSGDPHEHDDRVDGISGARLVIAPIRTWKKINFLKL